MTTPVDDVVMPYSIPLSITSGIAGFVVPSGNQHPEASVKNRMIVLDPGAHLVTLAALSRYSVAARWIHRGLEFTLAEVPANLQKFEQVTFTISSVERTELRIDSAIAFTSGDRVAGYSAGVTVYPISTYIP